MRSPTATVPACTPLRGKTPVSWKPTSLFESICSHKIFQERQGCRQVWTVWHVSVPFFVPSDFMEHFQNPC